MFTIKFPLLSAEKTIGVFSYATGKNIAWNERVHKPDFDSKSLDQTSFRMTVKDESFDSGESVSFSFKDVDGNPVIVENAIIHRSSDEDKTADQLEGILIAVGKDQKGENISVIVNFNSNAEISTDSKFYIYDLPGSTGRDIALNPSVNFLFIGNHPDTDGYEFDTYSYNTDALNNVTARAGEQLKLVKVQLIDAHGTVSGIIGDNDMNGSGDGGDYIIYTHPKTGQAIYTQSDSTMIWMAEVKVLGEAAPRLIKVGVYQMANGDTFVADTVENKNALDKLNIESIKLIRSVQPDNFGFYTSRNVEGSRVVCFSHTVPIRTPCGDRIAGNLRVGDCVETMDHGAQIIRWIGTKTLDEIDLTHNPKLRPIRIRQSALAHGLPAADILVSRQHRMLVRSELAQAMFGTTEILIPAIKLIKLPGIDIATDVTSITYVHFLLDQHEIIFAAGAPSESLLTGAEALKSIGEAARQEILKIFPDIRNPVSARFLPPRKLQKQLIARHASNNTPLLS